MNPILYIFLIFVSVLVVIAFVDWAIGGTLHVWDVGWLTQKFIKWFEDLVIDPVQRLTNEIISGISAGWWTFSIHNYQLLGYIILIFLFLFGVYFFLARKLL